MTLPDPPVLLITNRRQCRAPLESVVRSAMEGGCRWVSLREKDLAPLARRELLLCLLEIGQAFGACVTVHDDLEAAGLADGLHLPRDGDAAAARRHLRQGALLGQSVHSLAAAQRTAVADLDYVTVSPIFPSPSKPGYGPALGVAGLRRIAKQLPLPVVALGGVSDGKAAACRKAGAAGVAVMGAVMAAPDPAGKMAAIITETTQVNLQ